MVKEVPTFEVLGSRLPQDPGRHARLAASVREHRARLSDEQRARLTELLYADLFSEYDARFLSHELRSRAAGFSAAFRACEAAWRADEEQHYLGFRAIYAALTDRTPSELEAEMEARRAAVDFTPLAELLAEEFSIACLFAYDEAATVRAYRASAEHYALLGPEVVAFVREVVADEGRHVRNFLKVLRGEHAHRLGEVDAVLDRIRAHEHSGASYGNTFVLDHDDGVWSEAIFDAAASLVRRRLGASTFGSRSRAPLRHQ